MTDRWKRIPEEAVRSRSVLILRGVHTITTYLCRIVHLSRQLGIEEPHQLGQRHPDLPWSSFMGRRCLFSFTNMVEEIAVGLGDGLVSMAVVECSFLNGIVMRL